MLKQTLVVLTTLAGLAACGPEASDSSSSSASETPAQAVIQAEKLTNSSGPFETVRIERAGEDIEYVAVDTAGWLSYSVDIPEAGRYRVEVVARGNDSAGVWLEDYVGNPDDRTYNVTGTIPVVPDTAFATVRVEGSPFDAGLRPMRLHVSGGAVDIDRIIFTLMRPHRPSPVTLEQNMDGETWALAWSDEFEGESIDTTKWTYDIGNWGWGNNELQYYTEGRPENARIEDGVLIIEARKNDMGQQWTSTRLTTRGNVDFLYGKIEFRARVPRERGNWAAGWTLGDSYVDEKSWPYAGEIDILESVGYEVNDATGDGIAHATVHTPAYYFKIGNQISSTMDVADMADAFQTYAVEWTPTEVRAYVNDTHYYTYDKNADEREWPFDQPQNLILNLAMGGGWGGAQGMDETVTSQIFEIDYVRVYGRE